MYIAETNFGDNSQVDIHFFNGFWKLFRIYTCQNDACL